MEMLPRCSNWSFKGTLKTLSRVTEALSSGQIACRMVGALSFSCQYLGYTQSEKFSVFWQQKGAQIREGGDISFAMFVVPS